MMIYRIKISDRQRWRIVQAHTARDAIASVVGARFYSCAVVSWDAHGRHETYQVTMSAGPTRHGSTPVYDRWADVQSIGGGA